MHATLTPSLATGAPSPPAMPPADAEPVYDRAEALSRIDDDEALLNDLVDMFLGDAEGYMNDIRQAMASGDMLHLQRAAHTLKGILATFSAAPAQAQALALEQAARNQQTEMAAPGLERLEREMARLLPVLRRGRPI
jgi:HPt (histidine-containing phosphotransfer) domain-containing protein